jgi:membrane protein implicated in regulation of membrane protease activity
MPDMTSAMPIVWTVLIIVFAVAEAFTLGLTSIWFALGAIVALLVSLLKLPIYLQIAVFLIATLVLVIYTRPIAQKYLRIGVSKTNVSALVGEKGVVMKRVDVYNLGQVKVKGQIWTAKSERGEEIARGEEVEIVAIEGVKLIVHSTGE